MKLIHLLKIGEHKVENFSIQIGAMNYGFDLDGILGLDFLREIRAIINIDELFLYSNL